MTKSTTIKKKIKKDTGKIKKRKKMLSSLVIAFLARSKHLNFMASVTICSDFGAQENKLILIWI